MRVISGKFRGKKLFSPDGREVRPTADRVKESVFNIIQWEVEGKVFLDLFAGSGSMGIEALSRGAAKVLFSDIDTTLLEKNLSLVGGDTIVKRTDWKSMLTYVRRLGIKADIIYADPPYKQVTENPDEIQREIFDSGILAKDGQLLIEHGSDVILKSDKLGLFDRRKYGITVVDRFRYRKRGLVTGTFDPFTLGHYFVVKNALKEVDTLYVVIFDNPDKQPRFSVEKRIEMIEAAVGESEDGRRIIVDYSDGYVADYCKSNDIDIIFRGARNAAELDYERSMADYNEKHCGANTVIFDADDKYISSTEVKSRLDDGKDLSGYLNPEVERLIREDKR